MLRAVGVAAKSRPARAGALEAVTAVAKDTAAELVGALGGKADLAAVEAAVTAALKG